MKDELAKFYQLVQTAVLIIMGLAGAVGGVCWLGEWRTPYQYGIGLQLAGAGVLIIAMYTLMVDLDYNKLIGRTIASSGSTKKRQTQQFVLLSMVGGVLIALGESCKTFF